MESRSLVTVLRNNPYVPLGRFDQWLAEAGVRIRMVELDAGAEMPGVGELGEGLLVLGGSMNALADDEYPYLPALRALLRDAVDAELPVFGICLGHQLLGHALGGVVEVGASGGPERGAYTITWAPGAADDPVAGAAAQLASETGGVSVVLQSHDDAVVAAPPGAIVLASSEQHEVQAMRVGSATGVQFHPEATPEMLRAWLQRDPARSAAEVEALVAEAQAVDGEVAAGGRALASAFAAQVRARR